ncbi:MAG TPA: hypothetical protein VLF43_05570 [Candidatus Saccharimonadales bacterium]|nr:hypothetical protein [Candidatus Saccharimonadales bacterium]
MSIKLSRILTALKSVRTLYVLGAVLLLVTAGMWGYKQMTDPEHVFWGTIDQGLRSSGVTIKASQNNGASGMQQTLQYSLGATNRSYARTVLTQTGTTVVNEMIGTPTADYTRYASIKTDQKGSDGHTLNFSKVLGVWAKGDQKQLFSQAVLGTGLPIGGMVVPVASLSPDLRDTLTRQIKEQDVYKIDFSKVTKKHVDGRLQYVYDVSIKPMAYARLMKSFAGSVGLHDLDQLDPNQFNSQPDLKLKLTVDVKAHHVVAANVTSTQYQQTYHSYDVPVSASIPEKTISFNELQDRLRKL